MNHLSSQNDGYKGEYIFSLFNDADSPAAILQL
jgi:hypothetical protein